MTQYEGDDEISYNEFKVAWSRFQIDHEQQGYFKHQYFIKWMEKG